jgi:hypothetical protein
MGVKCKVFEGPDATFEADLQTALTGLTVLAASIPTIAMYTSSGSRIRCVIIYRDS